VQPVTDLVNVPDVSVVDLEVRVTDAAAIVKDSAIFEGLDLKLVD
jgi:hypothetical protein